MSKVTPDNLAAAIEQELTLYGESITERVNELSKDAAKTLAQRTKATAPKGKRGTYRKRIASKLLRRAPGGDTYVWYVKAPDHRLTHLLVHGHATKDGGRTKADPFLHNAWEDVRADYEREVEEAVKK